MNFDNKHQPQTPFDSLLSNPQLNMLKVMIPFLPPQNQSGMAMMIRMQEMQETMRFYKTFPHGIHAKDFSNDMSDGPLGIFHAMRPYLPDENGSMIDTLLNIMPMMEMIKEMSDMNGMGLDDDSENSSSSIFGGGAMDMVKGMLSPEQQGMFDMFSMMNEMNSMSTDKENYSSDSGPMTGQGVEEINDYEGDFANGSMDE